MDKLENYILLENKLQTDVLLLFGIEYQEYKVKQIVWTPAWMLKNRIKKVFEHRRRKASTDKQSVEFGFFDWRDLYYEQSLPVYLANSKKQAEGKGV